MTKTDAIRILGGTISDAAAAIGVSYQAVNKWPETLPDRIADRVLAALARKHLPPFILGQTFFPPADEAAYEASLQEGEQSSIRFLKQRGYTVIKGAPA